MPRLSAVSKAFRAVTRYYPVLLVLAVAAAVLAVVLALRRKEGMAEVDEWGFTAKLPALSGKDADFVQRKCATGMTWAAFKGNPEWTRFAKYDEAAVMDECRKGRDNLVNEYLDRPKTAVEGAAAAKCSAPCTSEVLRGYRPCANAKKSKCCRKIQGKLTDCVLVADAAWREKTLTGEIKTTKGCKMMYGSKSTWDGTKCVKTVDGVVRSCKDGTWCK